MERTLTPLERTLGALSSVTIVLSCIAAANDLFNLFADGGGLGLPQANLPLGAGIAAFYVLLLIVVFSGLMFFCRANAALLLFAPVVAFAIFWVGLSLREYAFAGWLGTLDLEALRPPPYAAPVLDPFGQLAPVVSPDRSLYELTCASIASKGEFRAWAFIASYQMYAMMLFVGSAIAVLVVRLFRRSSLGPKAGVAATAVTVFAAFGLSLLLPADAEELHPTTPGGMLYVERIVPYGLMLPYQATLQVYAGENLEFWQTPCKPLF